MEFSLVLLSKLISMMLMAVVGFVLVKKNVLQQSDSRVISVLLVYVLQPCLIFRSLQIALTPERFTGFVFGAVLAALSMLLSILFVNLSKKLLSLDGVDGASLVYANVGNLIMPLVSMSLGEEMIFYCSVFQIPFNLLVWTHGVSIIRGDKKPELKRIINPAIIALILGMIFLFTQTPIPPIIDNALKGFHDMVAASSMMLVGMVIAGTNLKAVFTYKKAYLISFIRLILLPILTMLLLYFTGLVQRNPDLRAIAMVIILGAAAPSGSTVVQLAVVFDKDSVKAGIYNVMTTVLCVVTLPFVILLFQMLFPA